MKPDISIVVPSYNSESTIRRCLQSLMSQQFSGAMEIVVVDSGTDATAEIVRAEFPKVRLIKTPHRVHQAEARNIGIENTTGPIIGFIDSDCVARRDWVFNSINLHERFPDVVAVTGTILNGTPKNLVGTLLYLMEFNEFVPGSPERYINILLGGNLSVKRRQLEQLGLRFPDMYHSEDTVLAAHIVRSGHKILFSPKTGVYHLNRTSTKDALVHSFVLGRASGKARKREGLYGRWLVYFPFLSPVLPAARWCRGMYRLIRYNPVYAALFFFLTPAYIVLSTFWTAGFLCGMFHRSDGFDRKGATIVSEGKACSSPVFRT